MNYWMRVTALCVILGLAFTCSAFAEEQIITQTAKSGAWHIVSAMSALLSAIAAAIAAAMAYRSLMYTRASNLRTERLFESQNVPLVQMRPVQFLANRPRENFGTTVLDIVNPSMVDALALDFDLRYSGDWINDWMRTRIRDLENMGPERTTGQEAELRRYQLMPLSPVELRAGSLLRVVISGSVPADLCDQAGGGNRYTVQTRISWRSQRGQIFNSQMAWDLECIRIGDTEEFYFTRGNIISTT